MNLLKHWFLKYIMPAFELATIKHTHDVKKPTSLNTKGQRVTVISWGGLNVKLRKPYR